MRTVLDQNEIMKIAGHFFDQWPDQKSLDWFKLIFPYFDKKGFFISYSEKEDMEKRIGISLIALVYTELCETSAWHEFPNYNSWSEERFIEIDRDCKEFMPGKMEDMLENIIEIMAEIGLKDVYSAFWRNCEEGSTRLIHSESKDSKLYVDILRIDQYCFEKGFDRFENGPFDKLNLYCSLFPRD